MNLMRGIDLKKIAEKMGGASGAELKVRFFNFVLQLHMHYPDLAYEMHVDSMPCRI